MSELVNKTCKTVGIAIPSPYTGTIPATVFAFTLRSGTGASTLVIRDGGAAGAILWTISLPATTAAGDACHSISFPNGIKASTSLYAAVTGVGAEGYVAFC